MNKKNKSYVSYNGRQAIANGEKTLQMWNRKTMLEEVKKALQEQNIKYDYEQWKEISTDVMHDHFLTRSSWHHINGKPVWFYQIDTDGLNEFAFRQMLTESKVQAQKQEKPKLMKVKRTIWKWSQNNEHQYATQKSQVAVVYHGRAYFENGKSSKIERGKCEVGKSCGAIVKENRVVFERIVHQMRSQYAIAI